MVKFEGYERRIDKINEFLKALLLLKNVRISAFPRASTLTRS